MHSEEAIMSEPGANQEQPARPSGEIKDRFKEITGRVRKAVGGPRQKDRVEKFTARAQTVLALAGEEAAHFNHDYIGSEHLLLGLVREGEGIAAQALRNLGMDLHRLRGAVEQIVGRGDR